MSGRAHPDIREWMKLFEGSALYRHDYAKLFQDWVEIMICCFANQRMEERYLEIIKGYTRQELDMLGQLMREFLRVLTEKTDGGGWYDMLGMIYEHLSSEWKRGGLGQFFTPDAICEVMASMTAPQRWEGMQEPCCGSGRMVLAARRSKNITYEPPPEGKDPIGLTLCIDVDPICVKMTTVNLFLHGIRAEVACANSLNPSVWHFAYQTHPRPWWPFIVKVEQQDSLVWRSQQQWATEVLEEKVQEKKKTEVPDLFTQAEEPAAVYQRPAA